MRMFSAARRWSVRHPQLASRIAAAEVLAPSVVAGAGDRYGWHYTVAASDTTRHVVVSEGDHGALVSSCDCPDRPRAGWRGLFRCKHRLAVALAVVGGSVAAPCAEAAE